MGVALTPTEVVTAYLGAFETGDVDAIAALVSADFVNEHTSSLGESLRGRDAYRARLGRFLDDFAGLRYDAERIIADGAHVAVPYVLTADWLGPDRGRHPISIRGMFHFEVAGDEIVHRVDYWDSAEFLRQTGQGGGSAIS